MVIINLISQRYVLLTNSQIFDVTFLSLPDNSDEMNKFELTSAYRPTGDQPEAIAQLTEGVREGIPAQTLLGVTGSGKTFTIANVIANINKPTLILSHNKTLAAQLYSEFKGFFPNNAVEYYVSYYDYYQPEAYLPSSDTYIEKDLAINDEIDKLRLAATSALLSGRKDVVVVSSVSCIYGMGNPADFYNNVIDVQQGKNYSRNVFLRRLVDSLYVRNDIDLNRGNFRVKGDTVDIYLAYADNLLRIVFWGDEVDSIEEVDPISGVTIARFDAYKIYPANLFMTTKEATLRAIHEIEDDLRKQVQWFENEDVLLKPNACRNGSPTIWRCCANWDTVRESRTIRAILTDVRRVHALTVYWISSPMISLSSLTRATSVFRRYEPCMAVTVPGKPIL